MTAISAPHRAGRWQPRFRTASYYVPAFAFVLFFLFPIVCAVISSLEPSTDLGKDFTFSNLAHLTLTNYDQLFTGQVAIWRSLLNSIAVAAATALVTVVIATMAGYAFARLPFRGSGAVFVALLAVLMIPYQSLLEPLFLVLKDIDLSGNLIGLALVYITFQLPFGLFVMRTTFQSIPVAMEEAAMLDGASLPVILFKILRPLVLPGMVSVAIFAFLFAWNDFLLSLTFITIQSRFTIPVALENIVAGNYGVLNFGQLEAGAVVSMVPCIILFLALQRYYVRGLVAGATR